MGKLEKELYQAAKRGDLEEIRRLVDAGASVLDSASATHHSAVGAAAEAGQMVAVELLVSLGARPEVAGGMGFDAMNRAMNNNKGLMVDYLLTLPCYSTPEARRVVLRDAIWARRKATIRQLIAEGIPLNEPLIPDPDRVFLNNASIYLVSSRKRAAPSWTPLHFAAALERVESAQTLLELGADPNVRDDGQWTPLMQVGFDMLLAASLIAAGADCEARDANGQVAEVMQPHMTALLAARLDAGRAWWEKVRKAAAAGEAKAGAGAKQGKKAESGSGAESRSALKQSLQEAARCGDIAALRTALASGADVTWKLTGGKTVLHLAAENGHAAAIEYLVQAGADPAAQDSAGRTPLHRAAASGRVDAIGPLLRAGADVDILDRSGRTPLHDAAFHRCVETARVLLEAGASATGSPTIRETPMTELSYDSNGSARRKREVAELLQQWLARRIPARPAGVRPGGTE